MKTINKHEITAKKFFKNDKKKMNILIIKSYIKPEIKPEEARMAKKLLF